MSDTTTQPTDGDAGGFDVDETELYAEALEDADLLKPTVAEIRQLLAEALASEDEGRARRLQELLDFREAEGNSRFRYDLMDLAQYVVSRIPMKRSDMKHSTGMQAVVVTEEELRWIEHVGDGSLSFVDTSGAVIDIKSEQIGEGQSFILLPKHMGEKIGEPYVEEKQHNNAVWQVY
jgi:hypothetical protein